LTLWVLRNQTPSRPETPWLVSAGMGGWNQPESVAGFNRNQWLASPEYACGAQALRARVLVAFRLHPASRSLPVGVGLAASGRKASFVVGARFTPAPLPSHARVVNKEAEASRSSWSVVLSSRPCCGLLRRPQLVRAVFSAAWRVVGLGVSFLKRSLRARPAPAACFVSSVAAVTALAFLRSRNRARLCHARLLW